MVANGVVLGITIWKTYYIFKVDKEARAGYNVTKTLAYNGDVDIVLN